MFFTCNFCLDVSSATDSPLLLHCHCEKLWPQKTKEYWWWRVLSSYLPVAFFVLQIVLILVWEFTDRKKKASAAEVFWHDRRKPEIQPKLMEADLCSKTSSWKVIFSGCCLVLRQAVVFCHRNVMFALKGPTLEAFIMIQSKASESGCHDFSGHQVLVGLPEQGFN